MAEWQPIETAPKDEGKLLLWWPGPWTPQPMIGEWDPDKYAAKPRPYWHRADGRLVGVSDTRKFQPTHWMPLPSAPA